MPVAFQESSRIRPPDAGVRPYAEAQALAPDRPADRIPADLGCSALEAVRRAYGVMAATYTELFGTTAAVHPGDLALIERHLTALPGTVLDVGCGPGHLTAHLRSAQVAATGIDLVPAFLDHARATHPDVPYALASARHLPVPDGTVAGILAWYSLIHEPPDELDRTLAELRRAMAPGGMLVAGFFDGDEVVAFPHKVVTAYSWPIDEFSDRLQHAGFGEVERQQRGEDPVNGTRPHAAVAARAG